MTTISKNTSASFHRFVGLAALLVFLAGASGVQAQSKIGFVDSDKLITEMPEFKGVEAQLTSLQQSFVDTLTAIQKQFETELQQYESQKGVMTLDQRSQTEARLNNIREQYAAFQQQRLGPGGSYSVAQNELLQPVREKVIAAIQAVAKTEKLDAVMDKGTFIYVDTKLDITYKVLDYIRRGQ